MNRRNFFKGLAAAVPFFVAFKAMAQDACADKFKAFNGGKWHMLADGEKMKYVTDSTAKKPDHPKYVDGSKCSNCNFYKKAGEVCAGYGQCAMVGNNFVSENGWCQVYKAKA